MRRTASLRAPNACEVGLSARWPQRSIGMRCRQRIGVATDDSPVAAVQTERGRDAQVERRPFAARADLALPMLLFEQRDEVSAGVARDLFESNALAVAEVGRCEVERLRDRRPAARHTAEWICQHHILT